VLSSAECFIVLLLGGLNTIFESYFFFVLGKFEGKKWVGDRMEGMFGV